MFVPKTVIRIHTLTCVIMYLHNHQRKEIQRSRRHGQEVHACMHAQQDEANVPHLPVVRDLGRPIVSVEHMSKQACRRTSRRLPHELKVCFVVPQVLQPRVNTVEHPPVCATHNQAKLAMISKSQKQATRSSTTEISTTTQIVLIGSLNC